MDEPDEYLDRIGYRALVVFLQELPDAGLAVEDLEHLRNDFRSKIVHSSWLGTFVSGRTPVAMNLRPPAPSARRSLWQACECSAGKSLPF
jgi:hypothetical protein